MDQVLHQQCIFILIKTIELRTGLLEPFKKELVCSCLGAKFPDGLLETLVLRTRRTIQDKEEQNVHHRNNGKQPGEDVLLTVTPIDNSDTSLGGAFGGSGDCG